MANQKKAEREHFLAVASERWRAINGGLGITDDDLRGSNVVDWAGISSLWIARLLTRIEALEEEVKSLRAMH